jgi:excisionase family DNA binding protein
MDGTVPIRAPKDGLVPMITAISLREAAERLGVHYMTAYSYVRTGRLPAARDGVEWRVLRATVSEAEAADSIGGVRQQRSVFNQIIGVTLVIATVVVALFFALLTVERIGLYGMLKAIGARSRTLFGGVVVQAVVVALVAAAIGSGFALLLARTLPPGTIPYQLLPSRLIISSVALVLAAVVGSAFSLRRVLRVDPASAIGRSS